MENKMTAKAISARAGTEENAPSATVQYDFGDNIDESVELFTAEVVHSRFVSAATVDLQALMRRSLSLESEDGTPTPKSDEEIQTLVSEWRPGVSSRKRKSASEKANEAIDALSEDERAALLDSLMAAAA